MYQLRAKARQRRGPVRQHGLAMRSTCAIGEVSSVVADLRGGLRGAGLSSQRDCDEVLIFGGWKEMCRREWTSRRWLRLGLPGQEFCSEVFPFFLKTFSIHL